MPSETPAKTPPQPVKKEDRKAVFIAACEKGNSEFVSFNRKQILEVLKAK